MSEKWTDYPDETVPADPPRPRWRTVLENVLVYGFLLAFSGACWTLCFLAVSAGVSR